MENEWLYRFKRRIIAGLVLLLALTMSLAMLCITLVTRENLLQNSAANTRDLAGSISSSLKSLMLRRSPAEIQRTIGDIGKNDHILKAIILDRNGRIAYSSDERENGTQLSVSDESCRGCHLSSSQSPSSTTTILKNSIQRNVTVIYNDPACYGCHSAGERINGKLIIDCSLAATQSLIGRIQLVILISGLVCLAIIALAIPYLSRSIDRYIEQVIFKNNEIAMVYAIIESVSRTIDMEDLKDITIDIVGRTFCSDKVTIVLPGRDGQWRIVSRTEGGIKEPRGKVEPGPELHHAIQRWQAGELVRQEISPNGSTVYLPIAKGEIKLALIEVRSPDQPFPQDKLKFMEAVIHPIAIAFENARLYTIAITDELTGLYTVRHFRTCMDRYVGLFQRHGEKFVLLMLDIDNFKRVNDTYGHPAGDAVIRRVSSCIAEGIRTSDLAFRYGGEEFAVLLPTTGITGGLQVAERVRLLVEEAETVVDGFSLKTTVSVGVAAFPDNAVTGRDLIVETDRCLYAAKRGGKNRVVSSVRSGGELPPTETAVPDTGSDAPIPKT